MRPLRSRSDLFLGTGLMLAIAGLVASRADARERGQAVGNAIWPRVTLSTVAVPAESDVTLTACFTNGQPLAARELQAGDALTLTLGAGTIAGCALAPSESGFGDAPDWSCSVRGLEVQVVYDGAPRPWPSGDVACVAIAWTSPARPTSARFSAQPRISGSMAPPEPAAIPIVVAPAGGGTGTTGGVGQRVQATSTRAIRVSAGDAPRTVPGLQVDVDAQEGSNLLVHIDGVAHTYCPGPTTGLQRANALILVDGATASQHRLSLSTATGGVSEVDLGWTWLSPPMAGGAHRVELAVVIDDSASAGVSQCVGDATEPEIQAHLTVIELTRPR